MADDRRRRSERRLFYNGRLRCSLLAIKAWIEDRIWPCLMPTTWRLFSKKTAIITNDDAEYNKYIQMGGRTEKPLSPSPKWMKRSFVYRTKPPLWKLPILQLSPYLCKGAWKETHSENNRCKITCPQDPLTQYRHIQPKGFSITCNVLCH